MCGVHDFADATVIFFPDVGEPADAERAPFELRGGGIGERGAIHGKHAAVERIVSGDGGEDVRAIFGGAGQRADFVHGVGERHGAVAADAAIGGPQAADAAESGRTNNGAPGFRADGEGGESCGDDGARAGGRAAGPTGLIPGIFGFALQGSGGEHVAQAAGEFDHGGFAEEDGSDVVEMIDHRGVVVEDLIGERFCAPGSGNALYGKKIFGGIGNAVERAAIMAAVDFFLGGVCLIEREIGSEARVGVEFWAQGFAAGQIAFGEFDGRDLLGLDFFGEFTDGGVEDRFAEHRPSLQDFFAGEAAGVSDFFFSRSTRGLR